METWLLARGTGFRKRPVTRTKLAVLVIVVTVVSVFFYFQFAHLYGGNSGLAIDWRLTLTFSDYRTNANYTLPEGIGAPNGIWSQNSTLTSLGPPGYAPLSTRSTDSTIWIQSNQATIFTFGDFFNIWGQTFNETCVSDPGILANTYCTTPAEAIVYDANNNSRYDPAMGDRVLPTTTEATVHLPPSGALLTWDPHLKFYDQNGNGIFDANKTSSETVVFDPDNGGFNSGSYQQGVDLVASVGGLAVPPNGAPLLSDYHLKFFDYNGNGHWDRSIPPPTLLDVGKDQPRCLDRGIGLSNGKTWIIYLYSPFAAQSISGAGQCLPPGY